MYKLIDDYIKIVKIDASSFEDNVVPVPEVKRRYGNRLSLLGGMDVDLPSRGDEKTIRKKPGKFLMIACMGAAIFLDLATG